MKRKGEENVLKEQEEEEGKPFLVERKYKEK